MSVGSAKLFVPRPGTPRSPIVRTSLPSLVEMLISCMSSSTIQRCFCEWYGFIRILCGPRPISPSPLPRGGADTESCCSHSPIVVPSRSTVKNEIVPPHLVGVGLVGVPRRPCSCGAGSGDTRSSRARRPVAARSRRAAPPRPARTLGPHARARSPRPAGMRLFGIGQRLRPRDDRLVVAQVDLADRLRRLTRVDAEHVWNERERPNSSDVATDAA